MVHERVERALLEALGCAFILLACVGSGGPGSALPGPTTSLVATIVPSPVDTASPSPVVNVSPLPSGASIITVPLWGDLWVTLPPWFTVPVGARPVVDDQQTVSFTLPQAPHQALGLVQAPLLAHGFSVDAAEKASDYEELWYSGPTSECEVLIVARASAGGSLVQIRYPTTCPW